MSTITLKLISSLLVRGIEWTLLSLSYRISQFENDDTFSGMRGRNGELGGFSLPEVVDHWGFPLAPQQLGQNQAGTCLPGKQYILSKY